MKDILTALLTLSLDAVSQTGSFSFILFFVVTYFFSAIPFSAIIPRLFGYNVLASGSKNPGFTNVLRTAGFPIALICLVFDMLKGIAPTYIALVLGMPFHLACTAGLVAVLGHCYSIFLHFKGGKGAATTAGVILALSPTVFLIIAAVQLTLIFTTKYMSVASMTSAVVFPIAIGVLFGAEHALVPILFTLFILLKHRPNIAKLRAGTENKITIKK